ncbi:MAG: pyruvyl-transferase [Candidatus Peregrinibacteria bacterium GW2011_GWF2_43_17]|nr:MAG: pyruvyl-transferase [Candidatus Peregrinibacteria bacterium GW2011_GWF2_43_17]HAU39873.1 hypothetical protein [Candidatus Peregrinibacteria bacterium]
MKILIIGNYGAKNFGDELVLKAILKIFAHGNYNFTALSADPRETEKIHGIRAEYFFPAGLHSLLKFCFFKTLKIYKQSNLVIFGGGTLFTDEDKKAIFIWTMQILPAILMKKKIICFRQGIGPIKNPISRFLIKFLFNKFSEISVRDKNSKKILESLGIKKEIKVERDPVFELEMPKSHGEKLLIALRKWKGVDEKFISKLIEFLKSVKMPINLLVFDKSGGDREIAEQIAKQIDVEITEVDFTNYEKVFAEGKAGIHMRLHANIISFMCGLPCIGFAYESKVENLFEDMGKGEWVISMEGFSVDELKKKMG